MELRKQAPDAPLLPEIELAVARTYERERNWNEAIGQYERWLVIHTNHVERPSAEYYRAWATFQAGQDTNALRLMTNLVAEFPTNKLTPLAQWWIADYYYGAGNFVEAEANYEALARITNGASDMPYQAQMMAGRAAVQRQAWNDATNYFTKLWKDANCPLDLRYQAMFAYGDILMTLDSRGTNRLENLQTAIEFFHTICESTNRLAGLAWGEMALCYFQFPQYDQATNAFRKVIDSASPSVNATARSIARIGMAVVIKKRADLKNGAEKAELLRQALGQYLDVLSETDLPEHQRPDAVYLSWIEKAGLDAGTLAEELHEWSQASRIYERLQELLPSLRATLEEKNPRREKRTGCVALISVFRRLDRGEPGS